MICTKRQSMSGYLVGIGKIRPDGSETYNLIKPVKNMIVKQGLNNWLRIDGNNNLTARADITATYNQYRYHPMRNIEYCAYGSSNAANVFESTTDLSNAIVSPYSTKKTNWPYCGSTRFESTKYRVRISHESAAAATNQNVKEIGYYLRLSNNTFEMFSRVVLPFTYQLNAGEKLVTTYELILEFPYSHSIATIANTGLHDANELILEAQGKETIGMDSNVYNNYFTFPAVATTGAFTIYDGAAVLLSPAFYNAYDSINNVFYALNNKDFPNNYGFDTLGPLARDNGASKPLVMATSYVYDSFQRDQVVTLPTFWPEQTDADGYKDIYYLNFNCFAMRFGHTVDGVFTPTPWRKYAQKIASFVYRQVVATADSIAWQNSNP